MFVALKKTNTATELWQLTQNWLRLLGINPDSKFCREEISTHPDYPAMTAVTDFLDAGNMQYNAVQADASYIHEFNYPLLAHIQQPGNQYLHIILNAAEWDRQKEITQHWSGIVLYPEKNAAWQNEQNHAYQKVALKNKISAAVLTVMALGVLTLSLFYQTGIVAGIFGLLSLLGLIISLFLLGSELGYQSEIVKQVCGAVNGGGCQKVLKSKYAKGLFGVTPADASVLYFATQFILYLLSPWLTNFANSLLFISLAGVPIAAWSIYTQAVKLKQWCALCLGVIGILLLQATLVLLLPQFLILNTAIPYIAFIILFSFLLIALLPVKGLIKANKTNQHKLAELKKWKADAELFVAQWRQEQVVDTTVWQHDLLLGNPNAPVLIIVACNPYCGPCAKAHMQLDELLYRFSGKVKVLVRLLCNDSDEQDKRTIAVKAILQQAEAINDNTVLQQMLSDWFALMNFEKWSERWKTGAAIDVSNNLSTHSKWVTESNIQFTPTFFINGKKLPGRYGLQDIEKLLPQLCEILTNEIVK